MLINDLRKSDIDYRAETVAMEWPAHELRSCSYDDLPSEVQWLFSRVVWLLFDPIERMEEDSYYWSLAVAEMAEEQIRDRVGYEVFDILLIGKGRDHPNWIFYRKSVFRRLFEAFADAVTLSQHVDLPTDLGEEGQNEPY